MDRFYCECDGINYTFNNIRIVYRKWPFALRLSVYLGTDMKEYWPFFLISYTYLYMHWIYCMRMCADGEWACSQSTINSMLNNYHQAQRTEWKLKFSSHINRCYTMFRAQPFRYYFFFFDDSIILLADGWVLSAIENKIKMRFYAENIAIKQIEVAKEKKTREWSRGHIFNYTFLFALFLRSSSIVCEI